MIKESGWLIEHGKSETSKPQYLCLTDCVHWTYDNLSATRFAREDDAQAFHDCFLDNRFEHRICEHAWGS